MLYNLALGACVIGVTVIVHTLGLIVTTRIVAAGVGHLTSHGQRARMVAMIFVVISLFAVISAEVWIWAGVYLVLDVLPDLEFGALLFDSDLRHHRVRRYRPWADVANSCRA